MMEYYNNYLKNLSRTPNESYRELRQAIINSSFQDTTLLRTIEEENDFDFKFKPIKAWVNSVTDAITHTEKDVKDYLTFSFQDCKHIVNRGKYYKFRDNYWLVYEDSNDLKTESDCKVRRCNNKLKWIDIKTGNLNEYPCILEYALSAPSVKVTKNMTTPGGHVTVIVQGNKITHKIKKNQRFIFNGVPYRFVAYNNYMQNDYVTEKVPMLYLDCYIDIEQENDDLINNIANVDNYKYKVNILSESFEQVKGFSGKLKATVTLNGENVDKNITWESSNENIVKIDKESGEYILVGNANESCQIIANIENSIVSDEITISIKDNLTAKNDIIIEPIIEELSLYDSIDITANLYKDGIKQDDIVTCIPSGLDSSYYEFINKGNNTFYLKNLNFSENPLTLTFSCDNHIETLNIKLGSLF